jgi:hypothetical protein
MGIEMRPLGRNVSYFTQIRRDIQLALPSIPKADKRAFISCLKCYRPCLAPQLGWVRYDCRHNARARACAERVEYG